MIITELYDGQGLGNQLWCYVTTRVIALDRGYGFGIMHPEKFKGGDFLTLDFGLPVKGITKHYEEKSLIHPRDGSDIRTYDADLVQVADNTKIDGCLQDEQYIIHRKEEIKKWLAVKPEYECFDYASDNICVINFRGSGYVQEKDFFLKKKYWRDAMTNMRKINPHFRFIVVTEDVKNAKKFFPELEVHHWNIAKDYIVIKNAHYLILSNSSFAQFPAWTSDNLKYCIAPKYWARHNISDGYWSLGYNIMKGFMYQDRDGILSDYDTCQKELREYMQKNKELYSGTLPYRPPMARKIRNLIAKTKGRTKTNIHKILKSAKKYGKKILEQKRRLGDRMMVNASEHAAKKTWLSAEKIAAYRKTIKIYDIFSFFNELDLLEIRLNILDPYVDYFVIVEATQTFSGHPKPLYYQENRERFKKWEKKIIHQIVDDTPKDEEELRKRLKEKKDITNLDRQIIGDALTSKHVGREAVHWLKEFYIKESAKKALIHLSDNDICYISDLDEIWNPDLVIDYTKDDIFKPIQTSYVYYLNNRSNEDWRGWSGTVVTKYKNIRNACLNHLRVYRIMKSKYVFLKKGGWHFSFQGGFEGARKKIEESKHFWYNPEDTLPNLAGRVKNNQDFRGRDIRLWVDERGLPQYLLDNKEKYKKFFK
jgi:hypothetical protein